MNTLMLRPAPAAGGYDWLLCDAGNAPLAGPERGSAVAIQARMQVECPGEKWRTVLLAPAEDVLLRELRFQPRERRHILSTVPFAFEDQLIEDSEAMHFATDQPASDHVHVAIVREQRMREWLEPLAACGLSVTWMAPEQSVLALDETRWQGWYDDDDRLVVRTGEHSGVAAKGQMLELALKLLLGDEQAPMLRVATADRAQFQRLVERAPEGLRDKLEPGGDGPLCAAAVALQKNAQGINLLQGRFALTLPWRDWLARWRWPLAPLAGALALALVVSVFERAALQQENLSLRQATQTIYAAMFPNSPMPSDLRAYLDKRLIDGAQAKQAGVPFTDLMSRIGQAAGQLPELQFTNLNYDGQKGEMRIDLTVPDFGAVTALREHLRNNQIDAKLLNSNAQRGGSVRVQLLCSNV